MKLTEKEIQDLEEQIPYVAEVSAREAYSSTLALGHTVLIIEDGKLIQVFPDGNKVFIENVEPKIKIQKGIKFQIK